MGAALGMTYDRLTIWPSSPSAVWNRVTPSSPEVVSSHATASTVPWLDGALCRIASLRDLEEGWDSYGARAIKPTSIKAAAELLRSLAATASLDSFDMSRPRIAPTADGGVSLVWETPYRSLVVRVRGRGGKCLEIVRQGREEVPESDSGSVDEVYSGVRWVYGDT